MADSITPETPPKVEGNEPVVASETPPAEPPVIPEEAPPETPPAEPAPEMSPEEKRDHDMRSWIGRRDAEIRTEIDRQNQAILEEIRGIKAGTGTPAEAPDPSVDAGAWLDHELKQREGEQTTYQNTLIKTGTALLQQDELVKADPELGQEIYQEIQQGRVLIDRSLPPQTAATLAIASAKSNVLTRRMTKKVNPLAANTPTTVPVSGIAPSAPSPTPTVKLPKMSKLAQETQKRYGMTDEEVAKVLSE